MNTQPFGLLSTTFQRKYLDSLQQYRCYYDDFRAYGDPDTAKKCFYFIHGLNGSPGQLRFALPSFVRKFGPDFYVRCLYHEAFASQLPIWEKYTIENAQKRIETIQRDLAQLTKRFEEVTVVCSSNGFYEFAAASSGLGNKIKKQLDLLWLAMAPDSFGDSPWIKLFSKWTGVRWGGEEWIAVPNHNLLRFLNPETRVNAHFAGRVFNKFDIEVRFPYLGLWWAYTSPSAFNKILKDILKPVTAPLDIPSYILAADHDGYWYGENRSKEETANRYLKDYQLVSLNASHLWVVQPNHLETFLNHLPVRSSYKAAA